MYSFIYPCEPFNIKKVDEHFKEEFDLFKLKGFNVCLIDLEEKLLKGNFDSSSKFIYRGWMLSNQEYDILESLIKNKNCELLTNKENYYQSHYLFNQYQNKEKSIGTSQYTPQTVFCSEDNLDYTLNNLNWDSFFVKDYVKSLTTERGSVANNKEEVKEIIELIKYYKGSIEGGISLRKVQSFMENTEVRYFVLNGKVYSPNGKYHNILENINQIHNQPFFSVDVILDENGKEWIVEIGDGQVSDLKGKHWNTKDFVDIFLN